MRRRFVPLSLAVVLGLLTACAAQEDSSMPMAAEESAAAELAADEAPGRAAMPATAPAPTVPGQSAPDPDAAAQRKIIYEGTVSVEVGDLSAAVEQARQLAQKFGGFVADMSEEAGGGWPSARLTVRVPAERFEQAMVAYADMGRLQRREITSEDVSEEWVDLEARLGVLEQGEQRLLELLKNAGSVSDLLAVERELQRVRSEIEQIEGRMRYLDRRVSLSTITLHLETPNAGEPNDWSLRGVVANAQRLFFAAGRALVSFIAYAIALAPFAALLWFIVSAVRRWRRRRRSESP